MCLLRMLRLYVLISRIMRLFKTSFAHAATMPGGFGKVVSIRSSRVLSRLFAKGYSPICSLSRSVVNSYPKLRFVFLSSSVCLEWRLLDLKLAAWLLNPDNPPQSFAEVLASVQLQLPEVRAHCMLLQLRCFECMFFFYFK